MDHEPLSNPEARALARSIVQTGNVTFSKHVREQMADRKLGTGDVLNVIRGGWVEHSEFENGSWRYRIVTNRMTVVVAFRSEEEFRIVTAWRNN